MSDGPERDLRIAIFTSNYDYIKDGVALTLNRLVGYLQKRNIPVVIFAPRVKKAAFAAVGEIIGVPSFPVPRRHEYRMGMGLSNKSKVRLEEFNPTLFHIVVPDLLGYRALRWAEAHDIPVVATYHTRYDSYLKFYGINFLAASMRRYFRWFYARCAMVYPPSETMADELRAQGITAKMEIFSRGVDADVFNPKHRDLAWRKDKGIADDEVVVTFVGRLVKEKNTEVVVSVCRRLIAQHLPFKLMIVGDGPEENHLRKVLPEAVFAGFLEGHDLARAYASSDVFFFPSETETFGNVTLEAMASGLPTVCALSTGSNSLVVDGQTGYLVAAQDHAALAAHLAALITDKGLRHTMASAARNRALTFDWDAIFAKLVASFSSVVKSHQP